MDKEKLQKFKDQVWITRVSRVNAESRLIKKEVFFQGINIYYSCISIIFSILSLMNSNDALSLMTVMMTISLLVVILYLNGQKYLEHAREYRKNYTALQKLEFQLEHIGEKDIDIIKSIEENYCELLDSSSNHLSYDYYCAIHNSNESFREKRWKAIKWKFYWGSFWRMAVRILIIILPFILYGICEVI